MKKLFLVALATIMLTGCGKEGYDWGSKEQQQDGYGQVTLSLSEGNTVYVKSTSEADGSYNVTTTNEKGGVAALTGEYSVIKEKGAVTVPVGEYSISAENITASEAETANSGRGQAHYAGKSTFNVAQGGSTPVSFTCEMVNSKVTFDYDDTFANMFHMSATAEVTQVPTIVATPTNSLTANRSVTLVGDIDHQTPAAESYYTVNENGTALNFTINAARKSDGEVKTFQATTPITLQKKTWHKVKIAASTTNGQATVTINVDGTITEAEEVTVTVDPYTSSSVQGE